MSDPTPMTPARFKAIVKQWDRHDYLRKDEGDELIEEVRRLQAEVERLTPALCECGNTNEAHDRIGCICGKCLKFVAAKR